MNQGKDSSEDHIGIEIASEEGHEVRLGIMGTMKVGGTKFEIAKYDGRTDYLLWERQVKGMLKATGFGRLLKTKPEEVSGEEWNDMQEMAVNTVMLYLQPHVIRQLEEYGDCLSLFEALQRKYHQKELSNRLYTSLKLMSFKMKEGNTKVQDHIDAFNDLVVDLQNLGEELSDERKALHLLSSLPPSYKNLSQVLLHRDRKTITYNEVVSALKTDELQQKMMQSSLSSTSSGVALNVNRGRSQKRTTGGDKQKFRSKSRGKSQDRKTLLCWKCGKASHMKKDCRGKASDPSSANANVASADLEDDLLNDDYAL